MTQIRLAPRRPKLDGTEPVITNGVYTFRPGRPYIDSGGQTVEAIWSDPVNITGTAVIINLDPLPGDIPYESLLTASDGRGGKYSRNEFRIVPASGSVLNWDSLTQVPGSQAGLPPDIKAYINEQLAGIVVGPGGTPTGTGTDGAFWIQDVKDSSAVGRAVVKAFDKAAGRTAIDAAPIASPTFAGTTTVDDLAVGDDATITGDLAVSGTVSIPNAALAIAKVSGLQTALDGKLPSTDLAATPILLGTTTSTYPARPATTRPVWFVNPNVQPTNDGQVTGGGGMVPDGTLPNGLMDAWIS